MAVFKKKPKKLKKQKTKQRQSKYSLHIAVAKSSAQKKIHGEKHGIRRKKKVYDFHKKKKATQHRSCFSPPPPPPPPHPTTPPVSLIFPKAHCSAMRLLLARYICCFPEPMKRDCLMLQHLEFRRMCERKASALLRCYGPAGDFLRRGWWLSTPRYFKDE